MGKIGRNDPCPCGSGRKYKKCCMMKEKAQRNRENAHRGAAGRALDWLYDHYSDEIARWVEEEYAGCLDDAEAERLRRINETDPEFNRFFSQNLNEFLLADGRLRLGRRKVPVMELVLGPGGPLMTVEQQDYLRHLSEQPLRLYEVQRVDPGKGIWVKDMLVKRKADAIFVREISATRQIRVWDTLGLRLIEMHGHLELSGAIYPIPRDHAEWLVQSLQGKRLPAKRADRKREIGHWIVDTWLWSLTEERPLPQMRDAATGDTMLFVSDHYRVLDWPDLERRLAAEADVEDDGDEGWNRVQLLEEGRCRSLVTVSRQGGDRLELLTRSRKAADEQKAWFERVAGDAVRYLTRDITDPLAILQEAAPNKVAPGESEIPVDLQHQIIREYKQKHYQNWVDEKLPALDGMTPRQAVKSAEGRQQVINLLKSMENMEAGMDDPFDFGFIWETLGLPRA